MILKYLRRCFATDAEIKDGACNKYGHDWEHDKLGGYYAGGVPHFGLKKSFSVSRTDWYKCSKCGNVKRKETNVGRVKVNKETDELTVVQ